MLKIVLLAYIFLLGNYVSAAPYTPASGDEIIAHWTAPKNSALQTLKTDARLKPKDPVTIVALANIYLAQASQPGQSHFYGLAQAALKPLIDANTDDKNLWLAWAQVQQHQHNFTLAQTAIQHVLQIDPTNTNAILLAARIYIIQENFVAARNSCLKLLGNTDLLTVTACSLEANSYLHPDDLKNTYQQLADLVERQGLPNDERATWLIQLLADLAVRNKDPEAAESWLMRRLQNASVNYLAQWADIQFTLHKYQQILDYLMPIVSSSAEMDDALLLRLALAEKKINQNKKWQDLLTERVQLREQRQDSLHASDMAIYYLDINFNPQRALYWAKTNIENTREYSDKNLLARAEAANQLQPSQSSITSTSIKQLQKNQSQPNSSIGSR